MMSVTLSVSVFTLTSMAVERCRGIANPLQPRIKLQATLIWIFLIWIFAFVTIVPLMIVARSEGVLWSEGVLLAEELLSSSLHCSLSDAFWTCIEVLIYLHACVNSIVYGSLTRQFRQGYVRFFRHFFCFGKTNVDYSTGVSENHTGDKHLLRRTQAKETLLKLAFTNPGMDTSDDDSCRHGRYF